MYKLIWNHIKAKCKTDEFESNTITVKTNHDESQLKNSVSITTFILSIEMDQVKIVIGSM